MNTGIEYLNKFSKYIERIDAELESSMKSNVSLINDISRHSLLGGGKRLRPLLAVLTAEMCGYNKEDIYSFSTIFEYIHVASLLHDDVLDNADMRRNKPSASSLWGNHAAVLVGDFLYSKGNSILVQINNPEINRIIIDTSIEMIEGQCKELANTNNWHITREEYYEVIVSKTASLISAASMCGALLSGAEKELIRGLGRFGYNLGVAFQLMDDVLDYISTEESFGKPVGKDLKEGKITLPLIFTLAKLDKSEVKGLEDKFKNNSYTKEDYENILKMVREEGAIEMVYREITDFADKAADILNTFPESPIRNELFQLNKFLTNRDF